MPIWLDTAQKYDGVAEIAGPRSNPIILGWIHAGGRSDAGDDSTIAWCGFFAAATFTECGMSAVVPPEPGAAKSWRSAGYMLAEPRVGAIIVMPRSDPKNPDAAHVGFVVGFDDKHVLVLAGNQGNKVGVESFVRNDARCVYRWPIEERTPAEMAGDSRIVAAAARQQRDKVIAGGSAGSTTITPPPASEAVPPPIPSGVHQSVDNMLGDLTWAKSAIGTMMDLGSFIGSKWWFIAAGIALYFFARSFWDSHQIKLWRTEDHNQGWTK